MKDDGFVMESARNFVLENIKTIYNHWNHIGWLPSEKSQDCFVAHFCRLWCDHKCGADPISSEGCKGEKDFLSDDVFVPLEPSLVQLQPFSGLCNHSSCSCSKECVLKLLKWHPWCLSALDEKNVHAEFWTLFACVKCQTLLSVPERDRSVNNFVKTGKNCRCWSHEETRCPVRNRDVDQVAWLSCDQVGLGRGGLFITFSFP